MVADNTGEEEHQNGTNHSATSRLASRMHVHFTADAPHDAAHVAVNSAANTDNTLQQHSLSLQPQLQLQSYALGEVQIPVMTVDAMREHEAQIMQTMPANELMLRAGLALGHWVSQWLKQNPVDEIWILAGPGHNGGDAWMVAGVLIEQGYAINICEDLGQTPIPARQFAKAWAQAKREANQACACTVGGIELLHSALKNVKADDAEPYSETYQRILNTRRLCIDGLLGIGARLPLMPLHESMLKGMQMLMHRHTSTTIALDCPSGLDCRVGLASSYTMKAKFTLSLMALKPGMLFRQGRDVCGHIIWLPLGLAPALKQQNKQTISVPSHTNQLQRLSPKQHDSHKGNNGHVLVTGGANGMVGAAVLASRSAIMMGAGKVSLCLLQNGHNSNQLNAYPSCPDVDATHSFPFDPMFPEVMHAHLCNMMNSANAFNIKNVFNAVVIGPGMGVTGQSLKCLIRFLESNTKQTNPQSHITPIPMVLDGCALHLMALAHQPPHGMATHPDEKLKLEPTELDALAMLLNQGLPNAVLTPHPLEAARLLGCSTHEIEQNRIESAKHLSLRYRCIVVLKGAGTIVCDGRAQPCRIEINPTGGPALATAGSGDVLAGSIAAFLAQGIEPFAATGLGVWLHGLAVCALPNQHAEQPHATAIKYGMKYSGRMMVMNASQIARQMQNHLNALYAQL